MTDPNEIKEPNPIHDFDVDSDLDEQPEEIIVTEHEL